MKSRGAFSKHAAADILTEFQMVAAQCSIMSLPPFTIDIAPGRTSRVDRARYEAVRDAVLSVLAGGMPRLTQPEMAEQVRARLPHDLFPGGEKAGWWTKTVQLDLKAKGHVVRDTWSKPLRWRPARLNGRHRSATA